MVTVMSQLSKASGLSLRMIFSMQFTSFEPLRYVFLRYGLIGWKPTNRVSTFGPYSLCA